MSIQPTSGVVVQGQPVTPTAVTTRASAAVARLGEVLKEIVHKAGVFATEDALTEAERVVSDWVSATLPASALNGMDTDGFRAAREDVGQRTPPGGAPVVVQNVPSIDYNLLAAAIMRAQQAQSQQNPVAPLQ